MAARKKSSQRTPDIARPQAPPGESDSKARPVPQEQDRGLSSSEWNGLAALWPGVMFWQRPDMTFECVSPAIENLTGWSVEAWQAVPAKFWLVIHELDVETVRQAMDCDPTDGAIGTLEYRIRNQHNGRVHYLTERRRRITDEQGNLLRYEGLWLDHSRQTSAEQRLANAGWKETLAVLTMGLAHDFNNVLAGICSLSDTYLTQMDATHPFHEGLSLIGQNARQASQLVNRIVNLHRGKTGSRSYHDLNEILREAVELLRKVLPRHIELATHYAETSLPLYVDAVEFRQVIINLALNAVDALSERGQVRFETALHASLPDQTWAVGSSPRVPACRLTIADNGSGIKAHHLNSIFDPFFTTKCMNKGSGLGLYNSKMFVEKHHGAAAVESEEGVGTAFHLWLPQSDFTEADQAEAALNRRRRSVMLVGASGDALNTMAEFLRMHNYQVSAVSQGAEGWLQTEESYFDGIILQVEARDSGAQQIIKFIHQNRLPMKVVLQILGCHQDQMETQFLFKADLILTPDLPQAEILSKLEKLFDRQGSEEQ